MPHLRSRRALMQLTCGVIAALAVCVGAFASTAYTQSLIVQIAIFAILSVSLNLVIGYTDLISFGHAGFFAIGGYVAAILAVDRGFSLLLGALAAVLSGVIFAGIVAAASLRLSGVYFALTTLGAAEIVRILSLNLVDLTRGPLGLNIPFQERQLIDGVPLTPELTLGVVLGGLALAVAVVWLVVRSDLGFRMVAVRENPELAASVGVRPLALRTTAFCISGAIAAIAGTLYAFYYGVVTPEIGSLHYTALPLLMVMFGGRGTLLGPILGAAVFILLPQWLGLDGAMGEVLFALILLAVVVALPRGVVGTIGERLARRPLATEQSTSRKVNA